MSLKSAHVMASLRKHLNWLQPAVHDNILAGTKADGLINDNDGSVRQCKRNARAAIRWHAPQRCPAHDSHPGERR
jgi:hypothetical protein